MFYTLDPSLSLADGVSVPFPAVYGESKLITGGQMYSNSRNVSPIPVGVAAVWNVL